MLKKRSLQKVLNNWTSIGNLKKIFPQGDMNPGFLGESPLCLPQDQRIKGKYLSINQLLRYFMPILSTF